MNEDLKVALIVTGICMIPIFGMVVYILCFWRH